MARALRVEYPGAIYHVSSRLVGSWREKRGWLFLDDRDRLRLRFLDPLAEGVEKGIPERVKYLRSYGWSSYPRYTSRFGIREFG